MASSSRSLPRRWFLSAAAMLLPRRRASAQAPSARVGLGVIGVGWMGMPNLELFLEEPLARVVAVCDVDANHLAEAASKVNAKYGNRDCFATSRFEDVLARADVDAVCLSLPDHWHGPASVAALAAGKDVYGEKPLAHSLAESLAICAAVERFGRVWQTGSWQRSIPHFRQACELVRGGCLGPVRRVEVVLPGGHTDFAGTASQTAPGAPPKSLDYDRWLGPAPWAPYRAACLHKNWRYCLDYGGGLLMDWIGHHLDIAHWGLGLDESGPIEVSGQASYAAAAGAYDAPVRYRVTARYPNDLTIDISGQTENERGGTKWIGSEGWIRVDRKGIEASRPEWLAPHFRPKVELPRSPGHRAEFLECVRSRGTPLCPAAVGLRSAVPGFLGLLSMRAGRPVRWDPAQLRIVGDPDLERLSAAALRAPWRI